MEFLNGFIGFFNFEALGKLTAILLALLLFCACAGFIAFLAHIEADEGGR